MLVNAFENMFKEIAEPNQWRWQVNVLFYLVSSSISLHHYSANIQVIDQEVLELCVELAACPAAEQV